MEENIKGLVLAVERRDELQRIVDGLEVLTQLEEAKKDVEKFRQAIIVGVQEGKVTTGQRKAELNGKILKITPRKGQTKAEVSNIDLLPAEFRCDTVEEDAVCIGDNNIYLKANDDEYYSKNNQVFKKVANEGLIKSHIKLGEKIDGVDVKVGRPSCVIEYNGVTI